MLIFARKVALLSGQKLEDVLLNYTPLYLPAFELGRDFAPNNPRWQEFLGGFGQADSPTDWTYQFHLKQFEITSDNNYYFGCFSYGYLPEEKVIQVHYKDRDDSGQGALSKIRQQARLSELAAMFRHIKKEAGEAQSVRGHSWLHNLEAYRRLYPPQFEAAAVPVAPPYQYLAIWGQFLDKRKQVKSTLANSFLTCLKSQSELSTLHNCFAYQTLRPECAITYFYDFYGV